MGILILPFGDKHGVNDANEHVNHVKELSSLYLEFICHYIALNIEKAGDERGMFPIYRDPDNVLVFDLYINFHT